MGSPSSDFSRMSSGSPSSIGEGYSSPPPAPTERMVGIPMNGREITYIPHEDGSNSATIEHEGKRFVLSGEKIGQINNLAGEALENATKELVEIIKATKVGTGPVKSVKVYEDGKFVTNNGAAAKTSREIKQSLAQIASIIKAEKVATPILYPSREPRDRSVNISVVNPSVVPPRMESRLPSSTMSETQRMRENVLNLKNDKVEALAAKFLKKMIPAKNGSTVSAVNLMKNQKINIRNLNDLKCMLHILKGVEGFKKTLAGSRVGNKELYLNTLRGFVKNLEKKVGEYMDNARINNESRSKAPENVTISMRSVDMGSVPTTPIIKMPLPTSPSPSSSRSDSPSPPPSPREVERRENPEF